MADVLVRPLEPSDRAEVARFIAEHWGAPLLVVHDRRYYPQELPGFVAVDGAAWVGLLTYTVEAGRCEIMTLDSLRAGRGIGSALIAAARDVARAAGCAQLWVTTTNDNLHALGFYQRRGFALAGLYPGAVDRARRIKPEIPLIGDNGIPLRDEIELVLSL